MKILKHKNKQLLVFLNTIKDYIFPIYCLKCHKEGEWLCEDCFASLDLSGVYYCPVCHQANETGENCSACKVRSFLTAQIAVATYSEESLLGNIIQSLKYYYAEDLKLIIDKIVDEFIAGTEIFKDIDYIIPVPLHKKRLAERGFNQAEVIAEVLAKHLAKPLLNVLIRTKYTSQQAKLSREARMKNLINAFKVKELLVYHLPDGRQISFPDRNRKISVVLVDDVFTTGSTMQEAAKALREAGVEKVLGFSLARG